MMDEVRRYLLKAEHALEVAEDLLKGGHAPDAASKIYYSMYYAAQALLNADGIDVVKHTFKVQSRNKRDIRIISARKATKNEIKQYEGEAL